jgi:hypothetical protein
MERAWGQNTTYVLYMPNLDAVLYVITGNGGCNCLVPLSCDDVAGGADYCFIPHG